jgi:hypothetical protein
VEYPWLFFEMKKIPNKNSEFFDREKSRELSKTATKSQKGGMI